MVPRTNRNPTIAFGALSFPADAPGINPTRLLARLPPTFLDQAKPIQRFASFCPGDVHSPSKVLLGLRALCFLYVCSDTRTCSHQLASDDIPSDTARQSVHKPHDANCELECTLFDVAHRVNRSLFAIQHSPFAILRQSAGASNNVK